MEPIIFNQDATVSVENNHAIFVSTVDQPQSVNQHTTTIAPVQIYTQLDINSKEFWELVKRAAIELRLNSTNISTQEHALVASEIAIAIQNTMDE